MTIVVKPLPLWAQGTFNGVAVTDEGEMGSATLTVSAVGKVSGKIALLGTNWTISASSYSEDSDTSVDGEEVFGIDVEMKAGKEARHASFFVWKVEQPETYANHPECDVPLL